MIGLAKKMQQNLSVTSKYDLSELKWVVFDECDKVKEDTINEFSDMLKTLADPKINTSTANVTIITFSSSLPLLLETRKNLENLFKIIL